MKRNWGEATQWDTLSMIVHALTQSAKMDQRAMKDAKTTLLIPKKQHGKHARLVNIANSEERRDKNHPF